MFDGAIGVLKIAPGMSHKISAGKTQFDLHNNAIASSISGEVVMLTL